MMLEIVGIVCIVTTSSRTSIGGVELGVSREGKPPVTVKVAEVVEKYKTSVKQVGRKKHPLDTGLEQANL